MWRDEDNFYNDKNYLSTAVEALDIKAIFEAQNDPSVRSIEVGFQFNDRYPFTIKVYVGEF